MFKLWYYLQFEASNGGLGTIFHEQGGESTM